MATATATESADATASDVALVDPRAPRVGQAITAVGLGLGVALDLPVLVYAVALLLVVPVLSGWRIDPYGLLWKVALSRAVEPLEPEPAAPHRFARILGAVGATLASVLLLAGGSFSGYPVGYVVAGAVAALAALAAVTGICLGCRMYRGVSLFRRLDLV